MPYFADIDTLDALDDAYRAKAKELHPDLHGGSAEYTERFQEMQAEYLQRKHDIENPQPKPIAAQKFKRSIKRVPATRKQKQRIVKHGSKFAGAVIETFAANLLGNLFGK